MNTTNAPLWYTNEIEISDATSRFRIVLSNGETHLWIRTDDEQGTLTTLRAGPVPDEDGCALLVLLATGKVGESHIVTSKGLPIAVVSVVSR